MRNKDLPRLKPTEPYKLDGSPFLSLYSAVKDAFQTLGLGSTATWLLNSTRNGGPRWIRTTDLTLIRRAL